MAAAANNRAVVAAAAADDDAPAPASPPSRRTARPPPPQDGPVVVGCGSCGVDYLAAVAAFPKPDEKLRTEALETQGGGNAANALTAAARLGLRPRLVSKVGGDGLADGIAAELRRDGVDDAHVLRASPGTASPFTYIIVDRSGGTRTCIHTPLAEPLRPEELTPELVDRALGGGQGGGQGGQGGGQGGGRSGSSAGGAAAAVAYFDGRMADAAIRLADAARLAGVPVLVEGERPRPGLDALLARADVVCTSAHFPRAWTGEATLGSALAALARRLPRARALVTTLGARGAVMLVRHVEEEEEEEGGKSRASLLPPPPPPEAGGGDGGAVAFLPPGRQEEEGEEQASFPPPRSLDDLIEELQALAARETAAARAAGTPSAAAAAGCNATGTGARVLASVVAATPAPVALAAPASGAEAARAAAESAARAAAMNADAGNARAYADSGGGSGGKGGGGGGGSEDGGVVRATVLFAPAASLPSPEDVVDTTGAGDAFIGSMVYAVARGLPAHRALRLAGVVAAAKCTALGARAGLPLRADVDDVLLR
jgi:sugar/nucleoside kinase (ribokinase family)